ncbi:L-fucose-proton symporter [Aquisphaera giovannonii]|uniref:L-fucose-proton symporter n=1 Tax=Aquisphaera giovannonii TaxID=406548 RepID=A0A5B9W195_9BACT|nr:MFS transporter [Aquisphaera giovannonii]QEH33971.1 L-fucose-proton symporter [Aquisphaera giovannonii]
MLLKTLPIFLAFFLMGLADAMGPNAEKMKTAYDLSNWQSTLVSFSVFIAFAVFSVPGGVLAARIGKKKLLLLGLGLNAVALVLPSVMVPPFAVVLGCIFLLGVGTTFLQVAGNPIMRDVSPEGAYSRNLALAQGIKGLGSAASTYIVLAISSLAVFKSMDWRGAFPVFCILMTLAFVAVLFLRVHEAKVDEPPSIGSSLSLLGEPAFLLAVVGIFLYVGAEASMGRFLQPTLRDFGMDGDSAAFWGPTVFFLSLTVGRLLGSAILTVMSPRTCFRLSALLGLLGAAALMSGSKPLSLAGVLAAGLGFANIWPMLFSITVEEKPDRANELSGLMCMAISGGAIVPLVMGGLKDLNLGAMAYVVPAACFAYLLALSLRGGKPAPAPEPARAA